MWPLRAVRTGALSTLEQSAFSDLYDPQGRMCVLLPRERSAEPRAADVRQLLPKPA
ncbi:hypothetical protein ABIC63_003621 [Pseudacidovorax sp. 1753]|uniref:hypothetical protein n=1 Tax=Pseudacidovorax sp. 1753 TaxID=3156419 RepID=UPI003399F3D6